MIYLASALVWFILGAAAGMLGAYVSPLASLLAPLFLGMLVFIAYLRTAPVASVIRERQLVGLLATILGVYASLTMRGVPNEEILLPIAALLLGFIAELMTESNYQSQAKH